MRLALRLGKTMGEINQMPSAEVSEWMAFFRVEGEDEKNRRSGRQAAHSPETMKDLLSAVARNKSKKRKR
jgi:hypothetical protein